MNDWFKVPGQGCPVALGGVPCQNDLDCNEQAKNNPNCTNLLTGGTGLNWTSNGAIKSSSAGNLSCHPYRKVCVMESYTENKKPYGLDYFTTIYGVFLAATVIVSVLIGKFDFLFGVGIHTLPILVGGVYAVWVRKCCRIAGLNEKELLLLDIVFHWLPALIFLSIVLLKNPKIQNKKLFWSGYIIVLIIGAIYVAIKYNSIEKIYNSDPIVLGALYLGTLAVVTIPIYLRAK